ncbi:uncharacterized protein PHALS_12582 [Plasmopara halstedii]|uniref:Uncharacterized protein n=1 Tax=Plasmopara halstedii TaxID=4781 RepID=A0A0P1ANJ7_PLAHL|nr:uncharacterized protein PHALS_12582 [Plasmopara halstedii]CEG42296.1 hypothetical protein PHALS_12582 [Plasmopara halstedii]|eukprot:XP_024578665.1 hypothetical protein PHALS_12582 [Plasmopara halstedii]
MNALRTICQSSTEDWAALRPGASDEAKENRTQLAQFYIKLRRLTSFHYSFKTHLH